MASRVRALSAIALLIVTMSFRPTAADPLAEPTNAEALAHLKKGNRHLDLAEAVTGDAAVDHYDQAIKEYEAGALLDPLPIFWLNIGLAHRKAGRYGDAARAYRAFLGKIADDPEGADLRGQVEQIIKEMEDAANQPPTRPAPFDKDDDDDDPDEKETPSPFTTKRKIAVGLGAVGVVAIGAGVAFGVRAESLEDDAASLCPDANCGANADEANRLVERAESSALYANVAYAVGAAAIVGGVILWWQGAPSDALRCSPPGSVRAVVAELADLERQSRDLMTLATTLLADARRCR